MIAFILLKLLLSIALTLYAPGYFLLRAIFGRNRKALAAIEQYVLSVGLSLFAVDFIFIGLLLFKIPINQLDSILILAIFICACWAFEHISGKKSAAISETSAKAVKQTGASPLPSPLSALTARQMSTFLLLFLFATVIRTAYIAQGSIPQTTDLGHHMYWAKTIVTTGGLPDYGMPDFIIGEHIVFGVVGAISQIDFISALPVAILLAINLASILAIALLSHRIAGLLFSSQSAAKLMLLTLMTSGVFYALSSPQGKYVSGGVIGNVFGNLLMPLILYVFLSALTYLHQKDKTSLKISRTLFTAFILLSATLAYTHHLTTFVFLFTFAGFVLGFIALYLIVSGFKFRAPLTLIGIYLKNLLSVKNSLLVVAFMILAIFVYPPSYLNPEAIDTAVGTPVKTTRTGMSIYELILTIGPWRFFYAALALAILVWILAKIFITDRTLGQDRDTSAVWDLSSEKKALDSDKEAPASLVTKLLAISLVGAWFVMLFVMSCKPALLKIDIPSNRVASYLTIPAAILSAIGIYYLLENTARKIPPMAASLFFIALLGTGLLSGLGDVSDTARETVNVPAIRQLYNASEFLQTVTGRDKVILKDHIYLVADTWVKLFLMRDYNNPLSRSILRRYDDPTNQRETCTRDMVAIPDSETGKSCFDDTQTDYVMLKPGYDTQQFESSANFSKLFVSEDVVIYQRQQP